LEHRLGRIPELADRVLRVIVANQNQCVSSPCTSTAI
jgi:hypothetical protein